VNLQVVDENSATIPGNAYNIGLETDHRGINKFESNMDPNYFRVLAKLKKLVVSAPDVLKKRGTALSLQTSSSMD
jgi:hypothetical protein